MDRSRQAPLSMGSPRQEYWTGLSFPPPGSGRCLGGGNDNPVQYSCLGCHFLPQGIFLTQGIEHTSSTSPALASRFFTTESPGSPGTVDREEGVNSGEYSIAEKHWVQKSKRFGIRTFLLALRLRLRPLCFKMREGDACSYLAALV